MEALWLADRSLPNRVRLARVVCRRPRALSDVRRTAVWSDGSARSLIGIDFTGVMSQKGRIRTAHPIPWSPGRLYRQEREPGSDVVTGPARSPAFRVGGPRSYTSGTSCLAPGTNWVRRHRPEGSPTAWLADKNGRPERRMRAASVQPRRKSQSANPEDRPVA